MDLFILYLETFMTIQLDSKQKSELTHALQKYMQDELDVELGQFDTEFLVDFISKSLVRFITTKG